MLKTKTLICSSISENMSGVKLVENEISEPRDKEILIRVKAASINFPDLLMTQGKYQLKPELPFGLGMEGSGIAQSVGSKVSKIKEGDEVTFGALGKGALTELICVNENSVGIKPSNLTFEQAAAFHAAYLTAYVSLVRRGELLKGENLLVHGATGGVGMAAVQLGKYLGAKIIATGTSEEKLKKTLNWGADHTVLTHKGDKVEFRNEVKEITGGLGADVIFDPVGGDVFDHSIRCINWGGRILIVGFASGRIPTLPINMALIKGFSVIGVRAGEFARKNPEKGKENNQEIRRICEEGFFDPYICKTFSLSEAKDSILYLSERKLIGKIVVKID
ncbi:MAG: NADPH:quinone oxidoreductase [Gammaproteobacteria bacterium]|nr:NADPH:quinone oxidoreductase [Gammaproteobacteria bacterium]